MANFPLSEIREGCRPVSSSLRLPGCRRTEERSCRNLFGTRSGEKATDNESIFFVCLRPPRQSKATRSLPAGGRKSRDESRPRRIPALASAILLALCARFPSAAGGIPAAPGFADTAFPPADYDGAGDATGQADPDDLDDVAAGTIPRMQLFSSEPPRLQEQCGPWVTAYADLHARILNAEAPARYAVYVPLDAGFSDWLSGLVTGFLYALITGAFFPLRLLRVPPSSPPALSHRVRAGHRYLFPAVAFNLQVFTRTPSPVSKKGRAFQIHESQELADLSLAFESPFINWSAPAYNFRYEDFSLPGCGGGRRGDLTYSCWSYVNGNVERNFFVEKNLTDFPNNATHVGLLFLQQRLFLPHVRKPAPQTAAARFRPDAALGLRLRVPVSVPGAAGAVEPRPRAGAGARRPHRARHRDQHPHGGQVPAPAVGRPGRRLLRVFRLRGPGRAGAGGAGAESRVAADIGLDRGAAGREAALREQARDRHRAPRAPHQLPLAPGRRLPRPPPRQRRLAARRVRHVPARRRRLPRRLLLERVCPEGRVAGLQRGRPHLHHLRAGPKMRRGRLHARPGVRAAVVRHLSFCALDLDNVISALQPEAPHRRASLSLSSLSLSLSVAFAVVRFRLFFFVFR
ncbi:MAG: hypothetical protein BJ554DRAFT_883 [Olpidium bornovanus]|uniref:Uncharacterized protein n=1 Tax=Olpidium bornovanus TaxID=278681 RepID=A0A8H7ZT85_9FUNG|nr:MAG: hypothetical protein BJ554DRAFT_883 [Olpidium bornovanus]